MANDLSAFEDRPSPKARARAKAKDAGPPEAGADDADDAGPPEANSGAHLPSPDPAPDHVPGLTAYPQPGEVAEERPGKEVSADAHDPDVAPILGFVDHQVPASRGGGLINVHTPGVILARKPTAE